MTERIACGVQSAKQNDGSDYELSALAKWFCVFEHRRKHLVKSRLVLYDKHHHVMRSAVFRQIIAVMAVAKALSAAAQTNCPLQYTSWLVVPEPQLRTEQAEPPAAKPESQELQTGLRLLPAEMSAADPKSPHPAPIVLSADYGDQDSQPYYRMQRGTGIIAPAHASDDPLTRASDSVFRPEDFHIGKTATFSCTILTAIERKDPLCLLNRFFLIVSW
jgi:hypothetical protein